MAVNLRSSEQASRLATLSSSRRRLHNRVTGILLVTGLLLGVGGLTLDNLLMSGAAGNDAVPFASYCQLAWTTGSICCFLSIMPTYARTIRFTSALAILYAAHGVIDSSMHIVKQFGKPSTLARTRELAYWIITFLGSSYFSMEAARNLQLRCTPRLKFVMPPRLALVRIWANYRLVFFFIPVANITAMVINTALLGQPFFEQCNPHDAELLSNSMNATALAACNEGLTTQPMPIALLVISGWQLLICFSMTNANRGRFVCWFGKLVLGEHVQSAATIASMLPHGMSPSATIQIARQKCRSLAFSAVTLDDFTTNEDTGLHQKTEPANLGSVTAFVSHSWRDSASPKYAALTSWVEERTALAGEPPTLWLDKACIDQTDISASLLCLPVFLACVRKGFEFGRRTACARAILSMLRSTCLAQTANTCSCSQAQHTQRVCGVFSSSMPLLSSGRNLMVW